MQVRWGTCLSDRFAATRRVRRGGVLNPYLRNICYDELSVLFGSARARCIVGNMDVNLQICADDGSVWSRFSVLPLGSVKSSSFSVSGIIADKLDCVLQTMKKIDKITW